MATLRIGGAEGLYPELAALAALASSGPITVNCYVTDPNSKGLVAHRDPYDIVVVQIAGTKQ